MTEEIISPIPSRLKNVAVGGHVAGAVDIIDDSLGIDQETINRLTLGDSINPTISVVNNDNDNAVSSVFVNTVYNLKITGAIRTAANITITRNGSELGHSEDVTESFSVVDENITFNTAGVNVYNAHFVVGAMVKDAPKNVSAVYQMFYGAQSSFDATKLTPVTTPVTTAKGTYQIPIDTTEKHIYFRVPKVGVTQITKVELMSDGSYSPVNGGIDPALGDDNYNVWVSTDVYAVQTAGEAGNKSFVVNR